MTELCGKGELFDLVYDMRRIPEDKARGIFSEILSAVEHAHANGIVHRNRVILLQLSFYFLLNLF